MLLAPRVGAAEPEAAGDAEGLTADLKAEKVPLKTDDEVAAREARSIAPSPAYTEEELRLLEQTRERYEFQSDVSRIMEIIINNVYTNRDVFLRELISNASDALDKIRLQSLTDPSVLDSNRALEIRVTPDGLLAIGGRSRSPPGVSLAPHRFPLTRWVDGACRR